MRVLVFFTLIFVGTVCLGGHETGNGGDEIRSFILKVGNNIVSYLSTPQGSNRFEKYKLSVDLIEQKLKADNFLITTDELYDNLGSRVDAIFDGTKIKLFYPAWIKVIKDKSANTARLVFHEILRLSGYFDDNYVISALLPDDPRFYEKSDCKLIAMTTVEKSDSFNNAGSHLAFLGALQLKGFEVIDGEVWNISWQSFQMSRKVVETAKLNKFYLAELKVRPFFSMSLYSDKVSCSVQINLLGFDDDFNELKYYQGANYTRNKSFFLRELDKICAKALKKAMKNFPTCKDGQIF